MAVSPQHDYSALRKLGELGRRIEEQRGADPYPRPLGPAPSLEELRARRAEVEAIASRHGASAVRVFGSVARGDSGPDSDLDLLVEVDGHVSLLGQAALQREVEELLQCQVHLVSADGLRYARQGTREQIECESITL